MSERTTATDWRQWAEGFQEGWDQATAAVERRRPTETGEAGCLACTYMDGGVYCSNDTTCPRRAA